MAHVTTDFPRPYLIQQIPVVLICGAFELWETCQIPTGANLQREVLKLVTEDMKNHEIALELGLTEHTVRNYIFQIFEKLGISTRVGLVLYALS